MQIVISHQEGRNSRRNAKYDGNCDIFSAGITSCVPIAINMGTAGRRKSTIRNEVKQAKRQATIRQGFAEAAELLGITHLLERFPHRLRQDLWNLPVGEPVVQADPACAQSSSAPMIRTELQRRLKQARFTLEDGRTYPVTHLSTFIGGLQVLFGWRARSDDPVLQKLGREGLPIARAFFSRYIEGAMLNLIGELRAGIADHVRLDRRLVSFRFDFQHTADGKIRMAVIFTEHDPQLLEVAIEGEKRTTYRCGGHRGPHLPFEWVEWPASTLGIDGGGAAYPVYVQKHALHRVEERLRELGAAAAHFWLWSSLCEPNIVTRDGDHYTIEYRFLQWRLGYLMGRRVGDRIVVTTFVFLTMQGSPEAGLLWQTLKLQRRDIEYQGLDELRTFIGTDILDDPVLLEIFRQCGCGHLAEMRALVTQSPMAYATELRKYLRLDEEKRLQALSRRLGVSLPSREATAAQAA